MQRGLRFVVTAVVVVVVGGSAQGVSQAAGAPGPGYLPYGVPSSPTTELGGVPEPYDPGRHGPPLANTQPLSNMVNKAGVHLPERPTAVRSQNAVSSGAQAPTIEPGSGDRGLWITAGSSAGVSVTNDAQTNLVIPPDAIGTTLYTPTHMAAGNSCIETTTAHWYYPGMSGTEHGHGFWDWCAVDGTGGWQVFEPMDSTWIAKYVRQRNGEGRYSTQVLKVGGCWKGLLYNFSQGQWEEKTTICGSGPYSQGWTMWESHYMMDEAGVCPRLRDVGVSDVRVLTGVGWSKLTAATTSQLGPYGLCWDNKTYLFSVGPSFDSWQVASFAVATPVLSASAALQGRSSGPITINVYQHGTPTREGASPYTATLRNGAFQVKLNGLTPGLYDIEVKHAQSLSRKAMSVNLVGGANSPINFGTLLTGDADNNNTIDVVDYNAVVTWFGKRPSDPLVNPDFDGNNKVDIADYNWVLTNFNRSGPLPPG
jgi:hypothetical protein